MKKWLINALTSVGILGVSVSMFMGVNAVAKQEPEEKIEDTTPTVAVEEVYAADHDVSLVAYGNLEPVEMTNLSSKVTGAVVYVNPKFVEGGLLRRGETLFNIDPTSFEAAVKQAEANLTSAEANLIEQQALADVAADEAKRNPNKKYTDLFLRKPQLMTAKASVKSAKASLTIAQRDLQRSQVTAPYDALIVTKNLGLGEYAVTGSPVATLYNIESAKVVVSVPGFDVDFLPEKLKDAPVTVSNKAGMGRQGNVWHDLGVIDQATRMTQLLIYVDDPYGLDGPGNVLKFGTYVRVDLTGKTLNQVIKVPQDLVKQERVWLVNDEYTLERKDVNVVREEPGYYFVSGGLNDGDRLVTTLPEYPQKGMAVYVEGEPKTAASEQVEELDSEEAEI